MIDSSCCRRPHHNQHGELLLASQRAANVGLRTITSTAHLSIAFNLKYKTSTTAGLKLIMRHCLGAELSKAALDERVRWRSMPILCFLVCLRALSGCVCQAMLGQMVVAFINRA